METRIVRLIGQGIRKTLHNNEWWFVIDDMVGVLADTADPSGYIKAMRRLDKELFKGWGQMVTPFWFETEGGKQKIDCANTEGVFRIIQSISSPKAEAIKRWLARVGFERVQEIEDPELATQRTRAIYKAKGYSDAWIEKRMHGIAVREKLTDEWKKRDVKQEREHEILTAEIAKAAFGVTPGEHKQLKGLKRENLRDHMNDMELIFSTLGEAATTEITKADDAQGFHESKVAARKGGEVAGTARKDLEKKTGKRVVSSENYLTEPESRKRLKP
jgi:DNA-damage-inducible protein D